MFETVILATDGSEAAAAATESAVALARRHDADLHVVHVLEVGELPPEVEDEGADAFATGGRDAVEAAARRAEEAGVDATTAVLEPNGAIHQPIVQYAEDADADLLVMGTHGRSGLDRYVLGSVTERTLRETGVPVLAVTADHPLREFETVLVPTDGSETALTAARYGAELAAGAGAGLHALNVVDPGATWDTASVGTVIDALESAGERAVAEVLDIARAAGVEDVESTVETGRPHRTIVDQARELDADLVVIATHGHTGIGRVLLGSVAERVVRNADRPVLAVGPEQD